MIEPTAGLFVHMPLSLRVRVKVAAAKANMTIAAVVSRALEAYLQVEEGANHASRTK